MKQIRMGFDWALLVGATLAMSVGCKREPMPSATETSAGNAATASAKPAASSVVSGSERSELTPPPKALGPIQVPKDNELTAAKIALGQKLFFDPRLSVDGTRSCYSCHLNENGTSGALPKAIGAKELPLTRNAPMLWNVAYLGALYWDGRAASLEAQALGAWKGGNMGVGEDGLSAKADEIGALPEYRKAFLDVFPTQGATPKTIAQALASYERTLFCGNTRYDRFAAGDKSALNAEEQQGWELFTTKANCHSCHTPPFFTDTVMASGGAFHNAGLGYDAKGETGDVGRFAVTQSPSDRGAFKTPSLRNVSKTAPYFHDGSATTLEQAVRTMAGGGIKNANLDMKFQDRKLSDTEIKAVLAFLGTLDCEGQLEVPEGAPSASPPKAAATTTGSGSSAPAVAPGGAPTP